MQDTSASPFSVLHPASWDTAAKINGVIRSSRSLWLAFACILLVGILFWKRVTAPANNVGRAAGIVAHGKPDNAPSALATWPWPLADQDAPHRGVTHWHDYSSPDGTSLDLFEFDFATNPRLRLELFDQDQHDATPGDNRVDFWNLGVGSFVRGFEKREFGSKKGHILAAWNGPFFGYDRKSDNRLAFHVAPVVLGGKVLYNTSNHRWAFGVKYEAGKPIFKVFHLPNRAILQREFDWASGGLQCLLKDGKPLKLQPFPQPGAKPIPQPVPSKPDEAGHIPDFDHMKSCRISLAWSRDNSRLYLLSVKEPDTEGGSITALRAVQPMGGGWMLSDVQNFWLALAKTKGIWGAVNNDAGDALQVIWRRSDNNYTLLPERMASPAMRLKLSPDLQSAPAGGTLMYWYVRE